MSRRRARTGISDLQRALVGGLWRSSSSSVISEYSFLGAQSHVLLRPVLAGGPSDNGGTEQPAIAPRCGACGGNGVGGGSAEDGLVQLVSDLLNRWLG